MGHFDLHATLRECELTSPLGDAYRIDNNEESFVKFIPQFRCGFTKHFFLQLTLNEFQFKKLAPGHEHKSTMFIVGHDLRKKQVYRNEEPLPVMIGSILVNRDEFPPRNTNEDQIEYLSKLTTRTRGIAHELLYADQYLQKYDWPSRSLREEITIPTVAEEDAVLCPYPVIARYLHTVEQETGARLNDEDDATSFESSEAGQNYYRMWLSELAVERDLVFRKTVEYLKQHQPDIVREHIVAHLSKAYGADITVSLFLESKRNGTKEFRAFIGDLCERNGYDRDTVCYLTERHLYRGHR